MHAGTFSHIVLNIRSVSYCLIGSDHGIILYNGKISAESIYHLKAVRVANIGKINTLNVFLSGNDSFGDFKIIED